MLVAPRQVAVGVAHMGFDEDLEASLEEGQAALETGGIERPRGGDDGHAGAGDERLDWSEDHSAFCTAPRRRPPVKRISYTGHMGVKSPTFSVISLVVVLGLYAGVVLAWVWVNHWNSPRYQSAMAERRALSLLGLDDGKTCSPAQLETAFTDLLEAARLTPEDRTLAEHLERLRWRFDERHLPLAKELERHAELVSAAARRSEDQHAGWLPLGARERGWAKEQVLEGPTQVWLWTAPGAVLIVLLWGWGRLKDRVERHEVRREHVRRIEAEVEASEASRRRS